MAEASSLGEALQSLSDPTHADDLLVERVLHSAARQGHLVRDLILYAALPTSFDHSLLESLVAVQPRMSSLGP